MALISCGECGGKVSDTASTCPHCGAPVLAPKVAGQRFGEVGPSAKVQAKKSGGMWKWFVGIPLGLFFLMMVFGGINSNPEKNSDRHAYENCMDSLKADDRARRGNGEFIAGACERMRNEYIRKYGNPP
jgi:hypothetical protein